ncbi:hypothetical protein WI87_18905 [Burkholderia ubonensis]|uniref:hypothetical protein n=1 Tax=Burkholderia ubonensis TaxID=101571 RepID=UPI000759DC80|nr:hypothetical protein [Burkholderia ubonensis]KVD57310.1 hypothetical protein WI87_18905 [Burkholderia ubonensis]KWE77258.1 hypothetical protein WL78_00405 [Burkholderia ubonensis]
MSALTPMQRLIEEGKAVEHSGSEVFGYWRGYEIWVRREATRCMGGWYIIVKHPDGGYLYDGWWEKRGASAAQAVAEAFRGACLLEAA